MTGTVFASALFTGTALVAAWFVVRFPRAAPASLTFRAVAPIAASFAVGQVHVDASDRLHIYGTVFGIAFPVLVLSWLTAFWLLQTLRDAVAR
jgi:hypothetical protein